MAKQLATVEVADATVHQRTAGGTTFSYQEAILRASEGESMIVQLSLNRDDRGYAVGRYYIGGGSFERDMYGRIALKRYGLELIAIPAGAK